MSRGPSPAFSVPPAMSSSASYNPLLNPSLRVDTEAHSLTTRLRSKSTAQPASRESPTCPIHQVSRSFSHVSPNSASPASAAKDVSLAVNGLRDQPNGSGGSAEDDASGLTMRRIHEALGRSGDEGDTLDLSRRGIEVIGVDAVEIFRKGVGKDHKGVWRLALSYNSLRDGSIVPSFAQLSRLRYLNLKGNHFSYFPTALTEMAALEILDLSKNQIDAFPEIPGRLAHLKVLSLTSNRIYTLPAYLTTFHNLKVFKVDLNPIEWPPREILGALIDNDAPSSASRSASDAASMASSKSKRDADLRPWIENMKSWMRQRAAETDRLLVRSRDDEDAYLASEEEPSSAVSTDAASSSTSWSEQNLPQLAAPSSQQTMRPLSDESTPRPGSPAPRPRLGQRGRSATLSQESLDRPISPGLFPPSRSASRHDRSDSTSSYTSPPASVSTAPSSTHSRTPSANLPPPPPIPPAGHSRAASYAATQRLSAILTAKKSLPDLRQSHAKIIQERRDSGAGIEGSQPLGLGINAPGKSFHSPSNLWGSDMAKTPTGSPVPANRSRGPMRKGSADMLRTIKSGTGFDIAERRNSQEGPLVDESRNSYFRRLSTLPVSSISKAIPPSLLRFIDAIRGMLFALSQLHAALRQYLLFAVQERIAGVFTRVMEPADVYMNNLINALDRFDSMSRRHTPPVHAIRGVIDSAKESVAVFAKVVAVLRLQVPALVGSDVRYIRTLLVMIYGSMAEVACAWQAIAPLLREIKGLLAVDGQGLVARALTGGQKTIPTGSFSGRTPISPIPERGESHSPPSAPRPTLPAVVSSPLHQNVDESPAPQRLTEAGSHTLSRRQAGSFSTLDVERGMLMGSPGGKRSDDHSSSQFRHRPSESAQMVLTEETEEKEAGEETLMSVPPIPKKATSPSGAPPGIPITPPELSQPLQPITMVNASSQPPRRGHGPQSSSGSSHALSISSSLPPLRKLSVEVRPPTPASATLFDEDLLDVIETAIDMAFTVWLRLAEDVGASSPPFRSHAKYSSQSSGSTQLESARIAAPLPPIDSSRRPNTISPKHHTELLQLLSQAEQITTTLRESLMGLRANPLAYSYTTLPDDAQAFIKTVVRVSELVKAISTTHSFPPGIRQSCSRLTQATRECAILIQVSSLRPGSSTPAPIPPASARPTTPAYHSRGKNGGPDSSAEDLDAPPSAGYQPLSAGWGQPPREGLRGLRLPMALGRTRSANTVPLDPSVAMSGGGSQSETDGYYGPMSARGEAVPRSAQASQAAF